MDIIKTMLNGLCMSFADSVPGVSGGTIAFVLGFYDKFIGSIHDVVSKDKAKRKEAIIYLIKLMSGWIIGFVVCATILSSLFSVHIYFMSSLFIGLTVASIPLIIYEEYKTIKGKPLNLIYTVIGFAFVVGIIAIRPLLSSLNVTSFAGLGIGQLIYVFFVGAVAIFAMVLPGISGSTVLLIAGVYLAAISSIKELLHFNLSVMPGVLALGFGILFGIAVGISFIQKALTHHRSAMIYFILGLLLGSFYAIVQAPTTLAEPQAALSLANFNFLAFIIGIVIIAALEFKKIAPLFSANKKNK